MKWMKLTALTGILACLSAAAYAEDAKPAAAPTTKPAADVAAGPAVNKNCIMDDKPVDKACFVIYKGQKIGFCCDDCIKDFKENPEKYAARLKNDQK